MAVTIDGNGFIAGSDVVTNSVLNTAVDTAMGAYVGATYGRKNMLINTEHKINQRGLASVTTDGAFGSDMWQIRNPAAWFTLNFQATDGTEVTPSANRMNLTFSATPKTPAAGEYFSASQTIEGYSIADLRWGTANARTITFSVDLKVPAGTVALSVRNADATRSYVAPIVISAGEANTWVRKSVTIPGCPNGTWQITTGVGMQVWLTFACGTTFQAPSATTWTTGNYLSVSSATNYAAAGSVVAYINAPQLERGSIASAFERAPFQPELLMCMRYYQRIGGVSVSTRPAYTRYTFMTPMRAAPTTHTLITGSLQGADVGAYDANGFYSPNGTIATGTSGWTLEFSSPPV